MTEAPARYPLAWPQGRPRTRQRKFGTFRANDRRITRVEAMKRLADEVTRLGGQSLVVSSDLMLRADGHPHMGKPEPTDPGVVAFFVLKGQSVSLPCDTFDTLAQNIAALAAHIEATRRIERYGVASSSETLQAFTALPSNEAPKARPWREVFAFTAHFPDGLSRTEAEAVINARYRERASTAHPDVAGGSQAAMADLNRARDEALAEVKR